MRLTNAQRNRWKKKKCFLLFFIIIIFFIFLFLFLICCCFFGGAGGGARFRKIQSNFFLIHCKLHYSDGQWLNTHAFEPANHKQKALCASAKSAGKRMWARHGLIFHLSVIGCEAWCHVLFNSQSGWGKKGYRCIFPSPHPTSSLSPDENNKASCQSNESPHTKINPPPR